VLEAFFRAHLRKHSIGRQIADGAKQHFQGDTLDIAEVRSNTLWIIALAIRNVVVDEAVVNFMMTDLRGVTRWVPETYARKLVPMLAMAVTPALGHPLLISDPMVRRYGLYDSPAYGGGRYTAHDRFCGVINRLVDRAFTGTDGAYNHRPMAVFTTDNSRVLSEMLLTCFLTDLYVWRRQGEFTTKQVVGVIGKKLIPNIRAHHHEKDKVATLLRAAGNLARKLNFSHPLVVRTLTNYNGKRVIGYKCTVKDLLKATRNTDEWGLPTAIDPISSSRIKGLMELPDPDNYTLIRYEEAITGSRVLETSRDDPDLVLESVYYRNLRRYGYFGGSAVHTWSLFQPLLSRKPVIVIGSGLGAVARVSLDSGSPFVFGLDLRSSLPLKSHRFRSYKPPLVMDSQYEDRYVQIPESFTTNGDWLTPEVSSATMEYDSGDCTVVVDIQSASHRYGLELLTPICSKKRAGVIIVRLYLTENEQGEIMADMTVSKWTFRSYTIETVAAVKQVIFVITSWSEMIHTAVVPNWQLTRRCVAVPYLEAPTKYHYITAVADAVFNVTTPGTDWSLAEVKDEIEAIVLASLGDYDSRFSYGTWTKYLRAALVIQWCCRSTNTRVALLIEWTHQGWAPIVIGNKEYRVTIDWYFSHHIASYGARICP